MENKTFSLFLFFADCEPATHYSVWIALITAISGIVLAAISQYGTLKNSKELLDKEREIEKQKLLIEKQVQDLEEIRLHASTSTREMVSQISSLSKFLVIWNEVGWQITRLWSETNTTRFLVLQAWNGVDSPKRTSAIIQYRDRQVVKSDFIGFSLDAHYVGCLQRLKNEGELELSVADLGDCKIGEVYRAEDPPIAFSRWKLIHIEQTSPNHNSITYCSFATDKEKFSEKEKVKQDALVDFIQLNWQTND